MLTTLLHEVRIWPAIWRRRFAGYRVFRTNVDLPFLAMLGLPVLVVAGIISFAYFSATRTEPAVALDGIPATLREAKRAHRREADLECLAQNVYFEARGEPLAGQYAVAEVTLNRTRAANFPHTICAVVHEMRWDPSRRRNVADFSWTELGSLSPDDGAAWERATAVATAEYDDLHDPVVPGALFYHSTSVRPAWARNRTAIAKIGRHVFYR
jgi:spore germination cell wall hydrolase CwlJ-like protein